MSLFGKAIMETRLDHFLHFKHTIMLFDKLYSCTHHAYAAVNLNLIDVS